MLYRTEVFTESSINPVTEKPYDPSWLILMITDDPDYRFHTGSNNGCAFTSRISRVKNPQWYISAGDFLAFHGEEGKNIILVSDRETADAIHSGYIGHSPSDRFLREDEPDILIHSTTPKGWTSISREGMLKSWNTLMHEGRTCEDIPIGAQLGDPVEFRDYIMFGSGITGEIVVSSRQSGFINMDPDAIYTPGARLYLDARRMAADGLLVRDGVHIKVKDSMPLFPYLLFAATMDSLGMEGSYSTPNEFACKADAAFSHEARAKENA